MNMKYVGGVLAVFVFLMPISFADASASFNEEKSWLYSALYNPSLAWSLYNFAHGEVPSLTEFIFSSMISE